MQSMPAGKVEVVGGVRDPDGTTLELRKTTAGGNVFGTAKLVKEQGAWKIASDNWRCQYRQRRLLPNLPLGSEHAMVQR